MPMAEGYWGRNRSTRVGLILLAALVAGSAASADPAERSEPRGEAAPQEETWLAELACGHPAPDRIRAARSLSQVDDPRVIPALVAALRPCPQPSDDPFVMREVIRALGRRGAPALAAVEPLLDDADPRIRSRALLLFTLTDAPDAQNRLVSHLHHDPSSVVRIEACRQLSLLGEEAAIPALELSLQNDEDADVREVARRAIAALKHGRP